MAKKTTMAKASITTSGTRSSKKEKQRNGESKIAAGGELHQAVGGQHVALTTNQGVTLSDNQNSLKANPRGPALLEDFILREKITHFDHERIPERIVHARATGVHGYFELTSSLKKYTTARILTEVGKKTPVFTRISTVAGGAGSVDTPRDVRGFAVKFYTKEGNWDLVGNDIPVFFIQDAIKFPDLIHAVKMEPDRGFPQSATAHDTFWDFISLTPESMHMVMWFMSDRTLPRSLRMIEGFGIHSFRLVNQVGESIFVKFHWRPKLGLQSTIWDETVKISGADQDFHRRDMFDAIAAGDFPEWEFAVQLFTQEEADDFPFDHLDATKLIPEELVPLKIIGRMVLDRWPNNFFAETEQVAYCPSHVVPGIDFSSDPLLQGRLFSYQDTQLSRLGSPNFHQIPINAPKCLFSNQQRDGHMQMEQPEGRVSYEPNSLSKTSPREFPASGFRSAVTTETGEKSRIRPESFADHYTRWRRHRNASRLLHFLPTCTSGGRSFSARKRPFAESARRSLESSNESRLRRPQEPSASFSPLLFALSRGQTIRRKPHSRLGTDHRFSIERDAGVLTVSLYLRQREFLPTCAADSVCYPFLGFFRPSDINHAILFSAKRVIVHKKSLELTHKLLTKVFDVFYICEAMVVTFNRHHPVVPLSILFLVALFAFDDPDQPAFQDASGERRLVHQDENVCRITILRLCRRVLFSAVHVYRAV
jgi:catalase